MFAPLKVIFGPFTPFSGFGLTRTKGPSASALLDWTAANWVRRVLTWLCSAELLVCNVATALCRAATCFCRAAISAGTEGGACARADIGASNTTDPRIVKAQMRNRSLCFLAQNPRLTDLAVTLSLTSLVFATRTAARLSSE